ncbi:uncharacterized protein A1O9_12455 [Exophiala aquamarina CBS 119918]|uniref:Major facilitator superfamily (MFS) profile domain-containing protein n=1 Tax=Exophiala aquamarina CBS 119918 TaxID=1182545 RepID=A0A072NWX1_9EURO|nr:uncharacterized protein A1O9_12455 [Exophiala aquamarina CBS 119918]KEF51538.1 hypothetical protein A1O9_12455 [Exophiala aquamarina CBS 119918]
MKGVTVEETDATQRASLNEASGPEHHLDRQNALSFFRVFVAMALLFLNYFLAQYDKFVLSYFQAEVIESLSLTSTQYSVLSGYATGILYALLALPVAFIADYTNRRVWVLTLAAFWWSLCVLFQGLSHNFWQILLARIGMGIGQAPVEALSISLISDLVSMEWLFLCESIFYVGVYVGEAVSGQIATAFDRTHTPWNNALKAIGIVGMVVAVVTRLLLREPRRRRLLARPLYTESSSGTNVDSDATLGSKLRQARTQLSASVKHVVMMKSFWILTLAAGARQFSGNVFGWYMPSYLSSIYASQDQLLSRYGIIVGVVGSVTVVLGGVICGYLKRQPTVILYLTAIGGIISSAFVICMVFSLKLANGHEEAGVRILYGVMSAAYLTAELWLGGFASLLALLLPTRTKTFCLAIYTSVIILIYSSAPQMIGLGLRNYKPGSTAYLEKTRDILAILIPVGYWVAGICFLSAIPKVKEDLAMGRAAQEFQQDEAVSLRRKNAYLAFVTLLASLTIALFITSLTVT